MINHLDRFLAWADQHPNESVGIWATRVLCGMFWAYMIVGFLTGLLAGLVVMGIR